jgi:hypothetical protein
MRGKKSRKEKENEIEFSSGDKLTDIQEDIKELKESETDNKSAKIAHTIKKNRFAVIALVSFSAITGFFILGGTIPEWLIFVSLAAIVTFALLYPYINKVVKYFIPDNRTPIIEIDNDMNRFGVVDVPQEKVTDIQIENGDLYSVATEKEGRAFQVEDIEITEIDGEQKITASASWEGSISNFERKQRYAHIEDNTERLEPNAQAWTEFKFRRTLIVQKITELVINRYAEEIEGVIHQDDLFNEIDKVIEQTKTKDEIEENSKNEKEAYSKEDLQEMADIARNGK